MVSTRNSVNARVEGLRSGADDYLGKPYDGEELRLRVELLLRTRAALDRPEGAAEAPADAAPARVELPTEELHRRMAGGVRAGRALQRPTRVPADRGRRAGRACAGGWWRCCAAVIETHVRKIDLMMRIDERGYLLVLPNTHFPGALTVAERISRETRRPQRGEAQAGFTVSIGVSFFPNKDTHTLQDMLELVHAALDRARREQGGKICLFQHQGYLYAPDD